MNRKRVVRYACGLVAAVVTAAAIFHLAAWYVDYRQLNAARLALMQGSYFEPVEAAKFLSERGSKESLNILLEQLEVDCDKRFPCTKRGVIIQGGSLWLDGNHCESAIASMAWKFVPDLVRIVNDEEKPVYFRSVVLRALCRSPGVDVEDLMAIERFSIYSPDRIRSIAKFHELFRRLSRLEGPEEVDRVLSALNESSLQGLRIESLDERRFLELELEGDLADRITISFKGRELNAAAYIPHVICD